MRKKESVIEKENLPNGWVLFTFGECLTLQYGKGLTKNQRKSGSIPVYGSSGKCGNHNVSLIEKHCLIIGRKGSAGEIHYVIEPCWPIDTTYFLTCTPLYDLTFLYYYFIHIKNKLIGSSTAIPSLRRVDVYALSMILPPLSEQKRIVAKIESIFTQIDAKQKEIENIETRLKTVLDNIHELKYSVLNKYFKGLKEKYGLKILDDVCVDIQPGFAQGKKNVENGIIHLRMNNIDTNFTMNFALLRTINATDKQREKYLLQNNDIIFVNTNSVELVGKSAIFTFDKPCLYSNHLTRLRANISILNPKLLLYYIHFKWMNYEFRIMCKKWINQAAVNTAQVKQFQIPLPPLPEQKRIVSKIESIFDRIDAKQKEIKKLELQLKSVPDSITALKGSILKLAFEGKLVPQDPNDEPASVLLEKIKSQKSKNA